MRAALERIALPALALALAVAIGTAAGMVATEAHLDADEAVQRACRALAAESAGVIGAAERMVAPAADSSGS